MGYRHEPLEVLDLPSGADSDQIQQRFRKLMKHLHPDAGGSEATAAMFRMVVDAMDKLRAQGRV